MSAQEPQDRSAHGLSFGPRADAYDRARPGYPADCIEWLVGSGPLSVIELGAGTGKLTEALTRAGHDVLATDPDAAMLERLVDRAPAARTAVAPAEEIPAPSRSVDVVVCAQSFHWFDHERALPEIARVLRPGGRIALTWNIRDEGIPWVRKLSRIIGTESDLAAEIAPLQETEHFGWVEEERFRNWSVHTRASLQELVSSRSAIALLDQAEQEDVLRRVGELYDDYGRGHDGMQLPYVTHCYRAVVHHPAPPAPTAQPPGPAERQETRERPEDPGTTLIDFR